MARRPAKKSRVVSVDFTDVQVGGGSFHIKEGRYRMRVLEVEQGESDAGNDMFKWTFEGLEKAAKGKKFHVYTTLNDEALWKLRSLLEALNVETPDGPMDIDLDEMVDLEIIGIVTDDTYQGKQVSRMNDFESIDGDESGDEPEPKKPARGSKKTATKKAAKEPEKVSADEVRKMSEDELADLVEEHSLEVDLDEHKTLRRKVNAVMTALEEGDLLEE